MLRNCFLVFGLAVALLLCGPVRAEPLAAGKPAPVTEDFFRFPQIVREQLSPDGDYLAMLASGDDGRVHLLVAGTSNLADLRTIAAYVDADIRDFYWVNDRRLVYSVMDLQEKTSVANGGLFAIDRDGSDERTLIAASFRFRQEKTGSFVTSRVLPSNNVFISTLPGESDDIIVGEYKFQKNDYFNADQVALLRLNTRTQLHHYVLETQPPQITRWLLDPDGEPRVGIAVRDGLRRVYVRDAAETEWRLVESKPELAADAFSPVLVGFDGKLYAEFDKVGVVYKSDLKNPIQTDKPILDLKGFDFHGSWEIDRKARKVLGVHFETDAATSRWFDPAMAAAQKAVDAALPATINTITCGNCLSSHFLLVESESDRQPLRYYLFDPAKGQLVGDVGGARPWITPRQMGRRDFVHYAARDGLQIPAYVTVPPGWKKGVGSPLIVLVHGGPWMRGVSWEWDAEAQFLATRGYVVMQPIFRGSSGFGFEFLSAGWHQWGLAMQDDLADAARWAVAQGYADPARIAIGGASYGGYATLTGLIRDPGVFHCGFEFAGVSDLLTMRDFAWSDASDEVRNYSDKIMIGDPEKDRDMLVRASPINSADRLTQPLLMAHGGDDVRVPIIQGTTFRDAVRRTNKNLEWIQYDDEGHGLKKESDRIDYWKRVQTFLGKCLGDPATATTVHAPTS